MLRVFLRNDPGLLLGTEASIMTPNSTAFPVLGQHA